MQKVIYLILFIGLYYHTFSQSSKSKIVFNEYSRNEGHFYKGEHVTVKFVYQNTLPFAVSVEKIVEIGKDKHMQEDDDRPMSRFTLRCIKPYEFDTIFIYFYTERIKLGNFEDSVGVKFRPIEYTPEQQKVFPQYFNWDRLKDAVLHVGFTVDRSFIGDSINNKRMVIYDKREVNTLDFFNFNVPLQHDSDAKSVKVLRHPANGYLRTWNEEPRIIGLRYQAKNDRKVHFLDSFCLLYSNGLMETHYMVDSFKRVALIEWIDPDAQDCGNIREGMQEVFVYHFRNVGSIPIIISDVKGSCGCTTPNYSREPIMPGKMGFVQMTYNSNGRPGSYTKSATVTSNDPSGLKILTLSGFVITEDMKYR